MRQRKDKIDDRPRQNPAYGTVMQKERQCVLFIFSKNEKEVAKLIKNAKPIWIDESFVNQYIQALRMFEVSDCKDATLQICTDTEYVAYINGKFVGFGQYKSVPGKKFYDEYDISAFLTKGENTLLVAAYYQGSTNSVYTTDKANLSFAVKLCDSCILSDTNTLVRPHPNYKSGEAPVITVQLGYVFEYNAKDSDHPWRNSVIVNDFAPEYIKRPVNRLDMLPLVEGHIHTQGFLKRENKGTFAQMMQKDYLSWREYGDVFDGKTVKKNDDGAYFVIDLGRELAGHFTMEVDAPEGTIIDIGYGEHLDDLRVRTAVGHRSFGVRYIGCGKEDFTAYFRRIAGRYISIHITNMTGDVTFGKIGLIPVDYPLSRKADFKCNDYLFEKLYKVSIDTLKLCMHEHHEDCPWREQALYAYDSYVQMLCGYYAFGEYNFARASLSLLADNPRYKGFLHLTSPGESGRTIPSFSLAFILSLEKYVLYSGDKEFGKQKLSVCKNILDSFEIKNDLVCNDPHEMFWHFFEWTPILEEMSHDIEADACTNFYYVLAVNAYNKLCSYFDEKGCDIDTQAIIKAANQRFYDEKQGLYKTVAESETYHELTQSLAYLAGGVGDEILDCLINGDTRLIKATLSTSLFKYDALMTRREKYIDAVTDEIAKVWGDMLFSGATSLWETSDGADAFDNAGSLCHAWSAVPVYLFYKYYIGFEPTAPGFESFVIDPASTDRKIIFETDLLTPVFEKRIRVEDMTVSECE